MTWMLALLASLTPAHAWSTHYLVTDRALERADVVIDAEVPVEPLEAFLAAEQEGLAAVFAATYADQAARGRPRVKAMTLDGATAADFFRAARLNPTATVAYVDRVLPDGPAGESVPVRDVATFLVTASALRTEFVPSGDATSARAILATYSDEPDWGIDHDLWAHTDYGYGEVPYGAESGESSRAAFHMQFAHENGLVRKFAPEVTEGMAQDRSELFVRLARHAFETGHPYWGYRLTAWAIHYAQDLTQPYHAKALPNVGGGYYVRYVVSPAKERMKAKASGWAGARHGVYEDFVALALQRSYLGDDAAGDALATALVRGDATYAVADVPALFDVVMAEAADHAPTIDATVTRAFEKRVTRDWRYDPYADPLYPEQVVANVDPEHGPALLDETGRDFEAAGRATRTVLRLARP